MNSSDVAELSRDVHKRAPVSHVHIFLVILTLLKDANVKKPNRPLRILDIGCGDGHLIDSLMCLMRIEMPDIPIEIYGFDISEHGYRDGEQKTNAVSYLDARHPDTIWKNYIKLTSRDAQWGYEEGFFDIAISNQVIEHVRDLDKFLDNLCHCVNNDGVTIHLFPLSHCIQEGHCKVPFAHWFSNFDSRIAWIAFLSRLGIGRYPRDRRILGHSNPDIHALETAKYIQCWTTYRSFAQVSEMCRNKSLSISYRFTKYFFLTKLRRIMGLSSKECYHKSTFLGFEWLSFTFCKYLSSSTLVIRRLNYDIGARIAAEKANKNRDVIAFAPSNISACSRGMY